MLEHFGVAQMVGEWAYMWVEYLETKLATTTVILEAARMGDSMVSKLVARKVVELELLKAGESVASMVQK